MRIGIFGGSFNPPHKLHFQAAIEILNHKLVDKVIYVPAGDKYAKEGLINGVHRYEMLRLMCEGTGIEVSAYEIKRGASYTYETLDYFKGMYPGSEIYFIMGADLLLDIERWKHPEYILENYRIIGMSRSGVEVVDMPEIYKKYRDHVLLYNFNMGELSSTFIRDKFKENDTNKLEEYLDEKVLEYISVNNLYR